MIKLILKWQQTNNTDCGIYAIAFATEVCHGNNPAGVIYATGVELRSHLLRCLEDGFITPIPSKPRKQKKPLVQSYSIFVSVVYFMHWSTNKISLLIPKWMKLSYCDCCQMWYHFKCLQINHKSARGHSITYDDKEEWICDECATKFDSLSDDSD